jgi:transcription elongation factor GreA
VSEPRVEYLTPAQRAALESELAKLEGPRREAAVAAIKTAREFGDLSENFEYHAAKNEQGLLERRITLLRARLDTAVTVDAPIEDGGVVEVGSVVEIEDEAGDVLEVEISSVGGVSPDSPLGSALLGARVGETVDVRAPKGAWRATVRAVRAA